MHAENTQRSGPQGAFHGDKVAGAQGASFGVGNRGDLHQFTMAITRDTIQTLGWKISRQGNPPATVRETPSSDPVKRIQQPSDTPLQITCAKPYQDADQYCGAVGDNTDE